MPILTAVMVQCTHCRKALITSVQKGTNPQFRGARDIAFQNGWVSQTSRGNSRDWCPDCWDIVGPDMLVERDRGRMQRRWGRMAEREAAGEERPFT